MFKAVGSVLRQYVGFQGRAGRAEYWWWFLFVWIVSFILIGLDMVGLFGSTSNDTGITFGYTGSIGYLIASVAFGLAVMLPTLAVITRRFHDQDKTGWLTLLLLIPGVGVLIILIFMLLPGTAGENNFGPKPA